MSMINQDPSIADEYSAEVIRLARERSPAIDAWIAEERYLNETVPDNLSPMWLRNRCVIKICEELTDMGIRVHRDPDDICDDPSLVYLVLTLRSKFDEDKLFELMKAHRELFEEIRECPVIDRVTNIIEWCGRNLPLDEGWTIINAKLDLVPGLVDGEDATSIQYLNAIIDRVDQLGDPDISESVDNDLVIKYIGVLSKRQDYIERTANMLWSRLGQSEYEKTSRERLIHAIVTDLEPQLGSKQCITRNIDDFYKLDLHDKVAVAEFIAKIRKPYLKCWSNCLEFYTGEEHKPCTDSKLAVMLATLIVDNPYPANYKSFVGSKLDDFRDQLGEDAINAISDKFDSMMANLVSLVEIDYAS